MKTLGAIAAMLIGLSVTAQGQTLPDYYPADYNKIIEGSRQENRLLVYSNLAEYNWKPIIEGFNGLYPWIKVETLDLPSGTVHARWEAEAGSSAQSADILVSGANDRWVVHGLKGDMANYASPELAKLESFVRPFDGVYILSTDPSVIVYNKQLIPEGKRPTGFHSLVQNAKADPDTFKGRITTYDAARNAFGLAAWWFTLEHMGEEGWNLLNQIGPMIRGETSAGPMIEKIATGEYVVGIGVGGTTVFPRLSRPGGEIMGYAFPDDGTPVMLRGMGIANNAKNANSARLFLDFALSHAGQTLLGKGGLTPHRPDVDEGEVAYTYQSVAEKVGEKNMIRVGFDKKMVDTVESFTERWNKALSGQ